MSLLLAGTALGAGALAGGLAIAREIAVRAKESHGRCAECGASYPPCGIERRDPSGFIIKAQFCSQDHVFAWWRRYTDVQRANTGCPSTYGRLPCQKDPDHSGAHLWEGAGNFPVQWTDTQADEAYA